MILENWDVLMDLMQCTFHWGCGCFVQSCKCFIVFREISGDFIGRFWEDVSDPVYPGVCHTEKILILNLTAEAVDSSMRTVMIGTGIPTACALMTLFWKDMRVQSLKGSIKQKHQQIMDGFMDGFGWIWEGCMILRKTSPTKIDQTESLELGLEILDWTKNGMSKNNLHSGFADSSGEIHIDYHTFT